MEYIKKITVKVTYEVSLEDIENVPEEVYAELEESYENNIEIKLMDLRNEYTSAAEWLSSNIKEEDCISWNTEIEDFE